MKYFYVLLISAFTLLNAQTDVQISNLELSKHQVLGVESINNNLFVVSFGGQGSAILDVINMDKNTIIHDILKDSGENITFGNANMFKDSKNNLWIGDINRLIKITENGEISNIYKGVQVPDSTYFEIKAITEDQLGNLYFLKRNSKILVSGEQSGSKYSWVEADLELVKFDGLNLNVLKTVDNIGLFEESIYYFNDNLYFSSSLLGVKNDVVHIFNLKNKNFETIKFNTPTISEIQSLEWEEVKEFRINNFFEFNNKLYFSVSINASLSYFKTFVNFDINSKKMDFISPDRNIEQDMIDGITSYTIFNDRIICSGYTLNGEERTFFELKNDKLEPYLLKNNLNPKIITSSHIYNELNQRKINFENVEFAFKNDMHIDNKGNLYAGTDKGLIFIENFIQLPSSVEKQEINVKTQPDLTNVKNELYIESEFVISSYNIFDINSRILQTESNLNSNNLNLNLEGLTIGIYFIELETQNGSKILKFIKN